jgi:hypothetical protein
MSSDYRDPTTWNNNTPGGIKYRILSQSGSFEDERAECQQVLLLHKNSLLSFVNESFPIEYTAGGFTYIDSTMSLPGLIPTLTTRRISWKSHMPDKLSDPLQTDLLSVLPGTAKNAYHDILEVSVDYSTDNDNSTGIEIATSTSGEFIAMDSRNATWSTGDEVQESLNAVAVIPMTEWTFTLSRGYRKSYVENNLIPTLRLKLGKVNTLAVPEMFDAPPETILFMGYEIRERRSWREDRFDDPPYMFTFKFLEKHVSDGPSVYGHNHFFRKDTGAWDILLVDGTNAAYRLTDFNPLMSAIFRNIPTSGPPP